MFSLSEKEVAAARQRIESDPATIAAIIGQAQAGDIPSLGVLLRDDILPPEARAYAWALVASMNLGKISVAG